MECLGRIIRKEMMRRVKFRKKRRRRNKNKSKIIMMELLAIGKRVKCTVLVFRQLLTRRKDQADKEIKKILTCMI